MKINGLKYSLIFFFLTLLVLEIGAKPPIPLFTNKYSNKVIQPEKVVSLSQLVVSSIDNAYKITWYKQPNASIEYYNIYRKSVSETNSDWICIGKVNYGDDAVFFDVTAKFHSNNNYDYRVSCVNPCGNELFSDSIVQPINLTIESIVDSKNNKLVWNPYKGMDVKRYYILSGSDENQPGIVDSLNYNNTSYVVQNPSEKMFYQIIAAGEIKNAITKDIVYIQVYSNKTSLSFPDSIEKVDNNNILVLSDYNNNKTLIIYRGYKGEQFKATLYDLSGRPIFNQSINAETFEIRHNEYHKGIYILQIENNGKNESVKLLI